MKETEMIHISRKTAVTSFFVLCALMIAAAPAFAQGVAFQASSLPQQARVEGLTETMGAVVIQATGTGTVKAGSSITVVYSGAITNLSTGGTNNGVLACNSVNATTSCAGLSVPAVSSGSNQLTVQFTTDQGFTGGSYIVVSQVRVNVNALGAGTSTVTATMSGTSSAPTTNPITFTQAVVVVASIVSPSLSASSTSASGLQTCAIATTGFKVTVNERYPAALTTLAQESSFTPAFPANNATAITVSFAGIPSGLAIAPNGQTQTTGSTLVSNGGVDPSFSAPSGGAVTYSFPLTTTSTSAAEGIVLSFNIGRLKSDNSGLTGGGPVASLGTTAAVTAAVGVGPVQSASTGAVSFAANSISVGTVATVGDCVTNLLFSFITNQVGFDTQIQIANTTSDDLAFGTGAGATSQSGSCTLSFYPTDLTTQTSTASGTAGTPSQVTTPTIPAGGVYSTLQSATSFKNQSGYMFAVCRFLDAHGFSFVTNGPSSTATISQGLLALVITSTGTPRINSTGSNSYEFLTH